MYKGFFFCDECNEETNIHYHMNAYDENHKYLYCSHVMRLCKDGQECSRRQFDDFHNKTQPYMLRSGVSIQDYNCQHGSGLETPFICKGCGIIQQDWVGYCVRCHFRRYDGCNIGNEAEFNETMEHH